MSDPLNPPCAACRVRPAQFGKTLCRECEATSEGAVHEPIHDRDPGDEHFVQETG